CRGVVHGDAARLLLLLFLWVVAGEIRGDPLPGLAMIVGAEQKLRSDVNRRRIVRRQSDRRIPVESQLGVVLQGLRSELGLNIPSLVRVHIYTRDGATLCFDVDVVGVRRIG